MSLTQKKKNLRDWVAEAEQGKALDFLFDQVNLSTVLVGSQHDLFQTVIGL